MNNEKLNDLTYNVMIIDDDPSVYEEYSDQIQELLEMEGYLLNCARIEKISDLKSELIEEADLFLVDLKFGTDDKGKDFIDEIRKSLSTDILFYSSDSDEIEKIRSESRYEGIYFATKDENDKEVEDKIYKLVYKMLKRSNTPIAMRGIVLSGVAELDILVKKKIEEAKIKISDKNRYQNTCSKLYYDSLKGYCHDYKSIWKTECPLKYQWREIKGNIKEYEITDLINSKITDSSKNIKLLFQTLTVADKSKEKKYKEKQKKCLELLDKRNILAHVKEKITCDGDIELEGLKAGDKLVLSKENCMELRKNILECYNLIDEII